MLKKWELASLNELKEVYSKTNAFFQMVCYFCTDLFQKF